MVRARVLSPHVGMTLLAALRDADTQRDYAEALAVERKRGQRVNPLAVVFTPEIEAIARQARGMKALESPR